MPKITLELIKKLRDKTQVGMMDCKQALILSEGDIEKAIEILRKKGAAVAAKRAERETLNGRIASYLSPDNKIGSLIKVSCETDFSANTQDMQNFAQTVCEHIANVEQCCPKKCDPACLIEQRLFNNEKMTIKSLLDELVAKISESIKISNCARFNAGDNGIINSYLHPGATLGAMVELEVEGLNDANKPAILQLARDLCMQVAVTNPIADEPSDLDPELIEKEKCIVMEQLKGSDKPKEIVEKIMLGRMNKFYEEVCLFNQKFIKQDKVTVAQHVKTACKEGNCIVKIKQYERFAT